MRTTLTLDDDVALRLERLAAQSGITWKEAVNRSLRAGLDRPLPTPPTTTYRTEPVHTGTPLVDLTRTADLLALEDERAWGNATADEP